jgi:hypothetical protein
MRSGIVRFVGMFLFAVLALSLRSYAQSGEATVTGEVVDEAGKLVPGAAITFTNINTNAPYATKTNGEGIYVLSALDPGVYRANVTREGFKSIVKPDIELHTQDQVSLNFSLQVGSVSETVTVSANAEHMPSDSAAVGLLVNRDFVENTPLNGRSFQDLIALAPGVVSDSQNSNEGLLSINGQRGDANYFEVDGVSGNTNSAVSSGDIRGLSGVLPAQTALGTTQSLISLDALQEFEIQTASYSAENGREPGGQVELTSRSGTNDFHGSAYDYFRNTVLDANSWFFNHDGIVRQPEHQNDFGATLGGPLSIPAVYSGKNKTFFFASYEELRLEQPAFSGTDIVPTVALREFASPAWRPYLNAYPLPNGPNNNDPCIESTDPSDTFACSASWSGAYSNHSNIDSLSLRLDQVIGSRGQIFVRYWNTPSERTSFNGLATGSDQESTTQNTHGLTVGSTWRISATLTDELRFNWTDDIGDSTTTLTSIGGAIPYPRSLVFPSQYVPAGNLAGNSFCFCIFSGPVTELLFGPGYGGSSQRVRQYNLVDNLSWTRGTHSLKFGGDLRKLNSELNEGPYFVSSDAESASSLQQGLVDSFATGAFSVSYPTFLNLSLYVQDHWKATRHLTIDYGVRWEFNPPPGTSNGGVYVALTSSNLATTQLAPFGTAPYHTNYHHFGPRLGFAYQANSSQSHPLVVRGAFGVFHDTGQNFGGDAVYGQSAFNFLSNISLPATASELAPPSLNAPLVPPYPNFAAMVPNLTSPYTEQWNLAVSVGISPRNTLTTTYVGNAGRKLLFSQTYDNFGEINPLFTSLRLFSNGASSSYNALQVQDQGYVAPGAQLIASYTWAHAIDDDSTDFNTYPPLRGNSDNDIRNVLNLALNYKIPGAVSNRLDRALTRGWSLDERFTAQTGNPITIFQGTYFNLAGDIFSLIIPDLVPGVPTVLRNVPGDPFGWALNPAAFSPVPLNPDGSPTRQGTLPRNLVHGPGFWNFNSAIQRDFPFTERFGLTFRADAFNLFNHANAFGPANCLCEGSSFGIIGGVNTFGVPNPLYATGSARSFQLMLKLHF